MNLLPEEDKISVKKEYLKRLMIVSGLFFVCCLAVASTFLFPALLFLSNYRSNLDGRISAFAEKISKLNTKELDKEIKRAKARISILESKKNNARLSPVFAKIIGKKTPSVKIIGLTYEKSKDGAGDKILISGKAGLRQDLLAFENRLKNDFGEQKVQSPISNLLKEKNTDFSLIIYIPVEK